MAVEQQLDQENQNQQQQPQGSQNQEQQLGTGVSEGSGSAAPSGGAGVQQVGSRPPAGPQGSGRFSNLQKYISANKDYNAEGGGISGKIQEQGERRLSGIRQGIESTKNQIQTQSNQLKNNLGAQSEQLQNQAFQDPNAVLKNESQLNEFQKLRTGGYGQDIGDLSANVNSQAQDIQGLQKNAADAGTEQGRYGLLRSRFSQPGYSTGQQRLDQLLLQGTPGSARSLKTGLQGMANQAGELQTGLSTNVAAQQNELGGLAKTRQDSINNLLKGGTAEGVEGELGQRGYEDIQKDIDARLSGLRESLPEQYTNIQSALSKNKPGSVDLGGITGLKTGDNIYNLDLSKYLASQDALKARLAGANSEQLLTDPEYQRLSGLSQLAAVQGPSIQADQVGKFNPIDFNKEDLQKDIATRTSDLAKFKENINPNLNRLQSYLTGALMPSGMVGGSDAAWANYQNTVRAPLNNLINVYKQDPSHENLKKIESFLSKDVGGGATASQRILGLQPYFANAGAVTPLNMSIKDYMDLDSTRKFGVNSGNGGLGDGQSGAL